MENVRYMENKREMGREIVSLGVRHVFIIVIVNFRFSCSCKNSICGNAKYYLLIAATSKQNRYGSRLPGEAPLHGIQGRQGPQGLHGGRIGSAPAAEIRWLALEARRHHFER